MFIYVYKMEGFFHLGSFDSPRGMRIQLSITKLSGFWEEWKIEPDIIWYSATHITRADILSEKLIDTQNFRVALLLEKNKVL